MTDGFAQQTFHQSDLVGKKWKDKEFRDTRGYSRRYTNTKEIIVRRNVLIFTDKYYISDTIDSVFDKSRVGNSSSGKFIITQPKSKNDNIPSVEEILVLTDNTLIVRNVLFTTYPMGNGIDIYHTRDWYKTPLENRKITQQIFQLSDIVSRTWKVDSRINSDNNYFTEYKSNGKCITKFTLNKIEKITEYEYYLSDTIEFTFDKSKVGKNTSGSYIIQRDNNGYTDIYEILRITNDRLILNCLNYLGGGIYAFHLVE